MTPATVSSASNFSGAAYPDGWWKDGPSRTTNHYRVESCAAIGARCEWYNKNLFKLEGTCNRGPQRVFLNPL